LQRLTLAVALFAVGWCVTGCGAQHQAIPATAAVDRQAVLRAISPIQHVVIIFQENRTPDNLFQGLAGADTVSSGLNSKGQTIPLHETSLAWKYDLNHRHLAFTQSCNAAPAHLKTCRMDGFDLIQTNSPSCKISADCAYGYVPRTEAQPYFDMATQYGFGDRMFQTNQGPSFPAHQEIISGDASAAPRYADRQVAENGIGHGLFGAHGGCDSPPSIRVETIALEPLGSAEGDRVFPCFERPVLADLLDSKGVSWRYYQHTLGQGLWKAYDAIRHIRYGPDYRYVIKPSQQILTDIKNGQLAGVAWVMPDALHSDHSGTKSAAGPSWVAAVVNAVGTSPYWNNTAIILTWDDWGGWYDHVAPVVRNNYELGFRVPLVVISPYSKKGYVSHQHYEFGSILKFTEETFDAGSLGTTDATSHGLEDFFDFHQSPRRFRVIKAPPFEPSFGPASDEEDY
jgi:phospholipase C